MAQAVGQVEVAVEQEAAGRERRRSPRYRCEGFAEALALQPETLVRGEIRDISQTGCFVMTRARLKLQRAARVELRFAVNGNRYRMDALVTDVRESGGMGLEFLPGDEKMQATLSALMETLSAAAQKRGR